MIERRQVQYIIVGDKVFRLNHVGDGFPYRLLVGLEQFLGGGDKLLRLRIDVSLLRKPVERVENTAPASARVVVLISHLRCYTVCGFETDSPDVIGKFVRILLDCLDCVLLILSIYLGGICCADTIALKEHHHLLDVFLLLPAFAYLLHTFPAEARHLKQTLDVVLDNFEDLQSEARHDGAGVCRTDTLDQSASEILLDTVDGSRHDLLPRLHNILLSVASIHLPLPFAEQHAPDGYIQQ